MNEPCAAKKQRVGMLKASHLCGGRRLGLDAPRSLPCCNRLKINQRALGRIVFYEDIDHRRSGVHR